MLGALVKKAAVAAAWLQVASAAHKVLDLTENKWTIDSPHNDVSLVGKIPSHVQQELYEQGKIKNPIAELNEFDQRWISYSNWTYTTDISGLDTSSDLETHLVFNGLDTFAEIEFCGHFIANTDNQFRQYVFNATEVMQSCKQSKPRMTINFGAAPNITEAIGTMPGQETWPGTNGVYEYNYRWFMRKQQNDFGWDWGPALSPVGVWQPAYIVQLDGPGSVYVKNAAFDLYRKGQLNNLAPDQSANWVFNASVDIAGTFPETSWMRFTITDPDSGKEVTNGELSHVENGGDVITGLANLDEADYELWWPNGLGSQKLYDVNVEVVFHGDTIASVDRRMGFRTVIVNMEPISEKQIAQGIQNGTNWHLEINGNEFYAKGSNFVPPDVFWPRVTKEDIKAILTDVVDSHQNIIRLWASGAYVPDFMYDLADEMGVMLWCEFEFSVSLYPVDKKFLENVRQEAVYQVRRANSHPSVALWAGGNEMEKDQLPPIRDNYPELYDKYLNEYIELFLNTLLPAVYGNSRSLSYMPCSTNNGYLELNHDLDIPFVDRLYNLTEGNLYGDSDFYDYDAADGFNIDTYVVNRFANEFGFPSMPSLESWREAVPEDELYFNSTMTVLRSRHYPPGNLDTNDTEDPLKGQGEMTRGVQLWYPIPDKSDSVANFSAWCHTTQIYQADTYHTKIQYYRAGSGMPQRQLGSIYWQLNDIWQAPSWSSREYDGRWKMVFYAIKDIYQPVIIAPVFNTTTGILTMYAVSDLWDDVKGEATWEWVGYDGKPVKGLKEQSHTTKFTVGPVNSTVLAELDMNQLISNGTLPTDNAVLVADLKATGTPPNTEATKTYSHSNFFTAGPLSSAKLVDPGLKLEHDGGKFTVMAEKGVSAFTWLAPDPKDSGIIVVFDDNGFLLRKGESRTVGYRIVSGDSAGWEGRVKASSIWDNTLDE